MKTTIHFLCVLLFSTILVGLYSCQKGDTPPPPDVVASVKDSTLLIKSIEYTVDGRPPLAESYDYDSVNRKVTLTWDDASGDYPKGYKIVLK